MMKFLTRASLLSWVSLCPAESVADKTICEALLSKRYYPHYFSFLAYFFYFIENTNSLLYHFRTIKRLRSYTWFKVLREERAQLDAGRVFARRTSEPIPTGIAVLAIWMGFSGTWWERRGNFSASLRARFITQTAHLTGMAKPYLICYLNFKPSHQHYLICAWPAGTTSWARYHSIGTAQHRRYER
jgi:hypothetical protein